MFVIYEYKINDYNKASDEKRKTLKKISTKGGNSEKLHDYSLEKLWINK